MSHSDKPPQHLSRRSKAFWRATVRDYALEAHHLGVLRLALEAWDRCDQAGETIAAEGLVVQDWRGNSKAHPAIAIERDSRLAALRALRELGLDVADTSMPRPPVLPANRGRVSNSAR